MKPAEIVNSFLSYFGFVLVRRSSLQKLSVPEQSQLTSSVTDALMAHKDASRKDIALLECKIDKLREELLRHQISAKWDVVNRIDRFVSTKIMTRICPLCGHEGGCDSFVPFESYCIFGGGVLTRFQCPDCDVVFGADKMLNMTAAELSHDYECHYKVYLEGDSTEQEIRAFHLLNPNKEGLYLNYGAGAWSKSVQILRDQGWNVFAFEPHVAAASNLEYLLKSKADLLQMQFDGVFSNNVLEHLRHPVEELAFMKDILKSGARMAHATPCFDYLYEYTRFHLFFYLGRSRTLLAQKSNLVMADFVVDGEFMCALFEKIDL